MPPKAGSYVGRRLLIDGAKEWPDGNEPPWVPAKVMSWVPARNKQPAHYSIRCEDEYEMIRTTEFVEKYLVEEETEETPVEGESHSADTTGTGDSDATGGSQTENKEDDDAQEAQSDASPAKSTRSQVSNRSPAKSPAKSPPPERSRRASRRGQTKATHDSEEERELFGSDSEGDKADGFSARCTRHPL